MYERLKYIVNEMRYYGYSISLPERRPDESNRQYMERISEAVEKQYLVMLEDRKQQKSDAYRMVYEAEQGGIDEAEYRKQWYREHHLSLIHISEPTRPY